MVRASGVLLHVTSIPSDFSIGDLGPESYRFIELLAQAKQHYWHILPLSPTRLKDGNSPYQTSSAFAANPLLISPEKLVENHLLPKNCLDLAVKSTGKVDFELVYKQKWSLLEKAYACFRKDRESGGFKFSFDDFCSKNAEWLNDYATYSALRTKTGKPWDKWPSDLRKREPHALAKKEQVFKIEIEKEKFVQYLFFTQWLELKSFCKTNQVSVIGDAPFYVAYDSADMWVHPELFSLNPKGKPMFVGGVPPDYFSSTGQLWGNPTYNWQKLEDTGFEWWINRLSHSLTLYDRLRLDHFRGFVAYWQVPGKAKTAKKGQWVKTPVKPFFETAKKTFPTLPFIAEDLGYIDQEVKKTIKQLGIPGMRVLLFGFDGSKGNLHSPKNHVENAVVFTGTHDTNTVKGWFTSEASSKEKQNLFKLLGRKISEKEVSVELVRLALASVADLSIVPLQDVLSLGSEARMNNPGKSAGNWEWRATHRQLKDDALNKLKDYTIEYSRT